MLEVFIFILFLTIGFLYAAFSFTQIIITLTTSIPYTRLFRRLGILDDNYLYKIITFTLCVHSILAVLIFVPLFMFAKQYMIIGFMIGFLGTLILNMGQFKPNYNNLSDYLNLGYKHIDIYTLKSFLDRTLDANKVLKAAINNAIKLNDAPRYNYDNFADKLGVIDFNYLLIATVYSIDKSRYNAILSMSSLDDQALSFANFFGFRTVSNMLAYFQQTGNYNINVFFERYNQLQQMRMSKSIESGQQPASRNEARTDTPTIAKSPEPDFHMITEDNFAHRFGCANFSELVFDVLYDNHKKRYAFIMSLPFSERQKSFANILGFDTVKDMQLYFDNSNSIDDMHNRLA